jgi:signal transduction histidine kinase
VLAAIIDNAITFAQQDGRIIIVGQEQPGQIVLSVYDTGLSVSSEAIADMFEPFVRGTSEEEYNYQGAGLSLYLCRLIMEHLGGSIELASDATGTKATLYIPINL